MSSLEMSGQGYKRTNFDDEDAMSNGPSTPPGVDFSAPGSVLKGGMSAWGKKTKLEQILIILFVIMLIVIIVLASMLSAKPNKIDVHVTEHKAAATIVAEDICMTPECITVSSSILNAMDRSVDPCDDFYHYACGGWIKSHPIPSGHSLWNTFGVLWQENQVVMKHVVEQMAMKSQSIAKKKAKYYYDSCMDRNKTIQKLGAEPLLDIIRDFGSWNISSTTGVWDFASWSLQESLLKSHFFYLNVFFSMWVGEDDKNSSTNILQLDQGSLTLPNRDIFLNRTEQNNKTLAAYLRFMTHIGMLLGGEENSTNQQMADLIEFETKIANITMKAEDRRDESKIYHKMTIKKVQEIAPFIDWLQYFRTVLGGEVNIEVTENEPIIVYAPDYLRNLSMILNDMVTTEHGKTILNNYIVWNVAYPLSSYLSEEFKDSTKELKEVLSGVVGKEEKWRTCITDTDSVLGFALGAMFVNEVFQGASKKQAEVMIEQVKSAFKKNLPSLIWMDDETRKAAVEKANAVVDMIGFPQFILNVTRLDKHYAKLSIKGDTYFENNVNNLKYLLDKNLVKLRKKPDKTSWDMTPPTVNAYYMPTRNEIVFPAGILQAPFYDQNYPRSLNFGAMGVVMGHELTHGFDDQGREFDKHGNLRPWWNAKVIARFKERAKCIIDQYSHYKLNGENANGKTTLGENIADNGGLKASFHAYRTWVADQGEERRIAGLNLTHNQLFFLGFSQVWCTVETKKADHLTILIDPHSPSQFRVTGPLSNSRDFARVYSCPVGSKMNPQKKCDVW